VVRKLALGGVVVAAIVVVVVLAHGGSSSTSRRNGHQTPATISGPAPPSGPPAKPAPVGEQIGVSVNRLFNDRTYSGSQIDSQLGALRTTGVTVARSDALWEATEPGPPQGSAHRYDWTFDDRVAGSLAAHGIRWFPILDYSPGWAASVAGQEHSPPRAPDQFAAFAHAFAARYGSGGTFWRAHRLLRSLPVQTYEVWNEPDNVQFWQGGPDAARYADLYLRTRAAVLSADPAARVIVGGLTHPEAFLREMVRARPSLVGHLDGVGIHPYGPNPFVVLARVRTARATMDALGLSRVPLYVTEFGWTTLPVGAQSWAPARLRPDYISGTLTALGHTDCRIAAVVLYTWVTPQRNPADHEDWFGIHPPTGAGSADTAALATGLRRAEGPAPALPLCAGR
jgi:hypothetical protein